MSCVTIGRRVCPAAANALVDALQRHGYCYLQHPAIGPALLRDVKQLGRQFFKEVYPTLSEFQKASITTDAGFRGYYRYIGASGRDDAIDCFSMGRDDVEDPAVLRRDYFKATGWEETEYLFKIGRRNPWGPLLDNDQVTGRRHAALMRAALRTYYAGCHEVSMDVLRHVATALGIKPAVATGVELPDDAVDAEYFCASHDKMDHNLEVKFYPSMGSVLRSRPLVPVRGASDTNHAGPKVLRRRAAKADPLLSDGVHDAATHPNRSGSAAVPLVRLDRHCDLSTITLLAQDAMGGLEVLDTEKDLYIPVPVLDDAVLLNAGTFLEKWTGGMLEATPHRVRSTGEQDRCSVVFFCFPNHDAQVTPLLQRSDNPAALAADDAPFAAGDMMPPL